MNRRSIVISLFGILCVIISCFLLIRYIESPNTGFIAGFPEVSIKADKIVYSPKDPLAFKILKNLFLENDQIISINGKKIANIGDFCLSIFKVKDFEPIEVKVIRKNTESILKIIPEPNFLRIDWILNLFFSIICFFIGFFLIIKLGTKFEYNIASVITFIYSVYLCAKPFYFESIFAYILIQVGSISPFLIAGFALYFPVKKGNHFQRLFSSVFILSLLGIFTLIKLVIYVLWQRNGSNSLYSVLIVLEQVTQIINSLAIACFIILIFHSYFSIVSLNDKRQIEWILFGLALSFTPYFFFDRLPFLIGEYVGEKISLGSFTSVFLCIFPIFFFIGTVTNRTLNIKYLIRRVFTFLIVVLLLLLFFLIVLEPASGYLSEIYGLSLKSGLFILTAIFVIILFVFDFLIDKIVDYFIRKNGRNTLYMTESKLNDFKVEYENLLRKNRMGFQEEKLKDLSLFFIHIKNRTESPYQNMKGGLIKLEKTLKSLFKLFPENYKIDEHEMKHLKKEIDQGLNATKGAIVLFRDLFTRLDSVLSIRPSIKSWINPGYAAKIAVCEMEKLFEDIEIELHINTHKRILCAQSELILVLSEIIRNACESEAGNFNKVEVRVIGAGTRIEFIVIDSGMGINDATRDKIYDPFFSTKDGHDGLGLYLCKSLIEKNNGAIEYPNSSGIGTKAVISFPVESEEK